MLSQVTEHIVKYKKYMIKAIISIGVPGAGKTTALKDFAERYNYCYISSDGLKVEKWGEEEDRTTPEKKQMWKERNIWVEEEMRKRVKESLGQGKTIVVDATFTRAEIRKKWLEFFRENGAERIQAILFDTPVEVAKERSSLREKKVLEADIERASADLEKEWPNTEEGFDSILTLDEYKNIVEAEIGRSEDEGSLRKEFR